MCLRGPPLCASRWEWGRGEAAICRQMGTGEGRSIKDVRSVRVHPPSSTAVRPVLTTAVDAVVVRNIQAPTLAPSLLAFLRSDVGPWLAAQEAAGEGAAPELLGGRGRGGKAAAAAAVDGGGTGGTGGGASSAQLDELMRRVRVAERVLAVAAAGGRADGSSQRAASLS